jgi:outer membrane protein OmpA-like peptidoglycan-associated protein
MSHYGQRGAMSFDYNKSKNSHGNDSFWTSYSDLFLGLSAIFLLLYVTSSLRTGTDALKNQVENQKLTMQVQELSNQLKMYESVKNDYMKKEAPVDEQSEYQELLDKLTLLEEVAKDDKTRLAQESLENERKAKALNKYQQMIRNVLNANKVAKSRILSRGDIIEEQIEEIGQQKESITKLEKDVEQKKNMLEDNSRKISASESALKKSMKDLRLAFQANKMTKKNFELKVKKLKDESLRHIASLKQVNQKYEGQINEGTQKIAELGRALASTQGTLESTKGALESTKGELSQVQNQAAGLQKALADSEGAARGLKGQIGQLQKGFADERARDRAAFQGEMNKLKLGAKERAAREGQFRAAAARKESELNKKLAGLQGQLQDTEGALAKAKDEIDTRRGIASEIQKGFAASGVKADIDMQTGEVVLDFGDAYFESDSAKLKPEMRRVLEKAMPVYSKSLFGNPKVSSKISTVEIIGFASPTYKGRYIDPSSTRPEDREALKYNMDLSYQRANSIFSHLLEDHNPNFRHQKELLSFMKVSGRSFLEVMNVQDRNVATATEFCRQNDCKKAQKVIIRFSMDKKK